MFQNYCVESDPESKIKLKHEYLKFVHVYEFCSLQRPIKFLSHDDLSTQTDYMMNAKVCNFLSTIKMFERFLAPQIINNNTFSLFFKEYHLFYVE